MTDINSLVPLPSQPRSHRKTKSGVVTPRIIYRSSNNSNFQSLASAPPGQVAVSPSNRIIATVTPGSNMRKDSRNSRNENRTNISEQDIRDGMEALKKGFGNFKVVTEKGELGDMLDKILRCYKRGYCADRPGNNVEGKHVIKL